MNSNNKRVIICLPNQPNLYGVMTLENAKSLAEEKSLDKSDNVLIIVFDNNNDIVAYLERKDKEWKEKETIRLTFA